MTEKEKPDESGQVPPPSYIEAVSHPPPPGPPGPRSGDCLLEVGQVRPTAAQELGSERVEVTCRACHRQVRLSDTQTVISSL